MAHPATNWTIPNMLTLGRILLTPLFVALFLEGHALAALSLFVLAGMTDALDGFLARVLDQRSILGEMLDPLADKVLLDSAFVCLAMAGWLPAWLAAAVVGRDAVILGGLALLAFLGRVVRGRTQPSLVSKGATMCQMLLVLGTFIYELAPWAGAWAMPLEALIWLTIVLTVGSGVHYVRKGFALFAEGRRV